MRKRLAVVAVVALVAAASAVAQQVQVREETLPNGMRLLLVERHDTPTVACGWVARVGSVNEWPGVTGISHLFEHMMFKGTEVIGTRDFARDTEIRARQDAVRAEMEKEFALLRERLRRGEIGGNIYDAANQTPRLAQLKADLEKLYAAEKELIVKDELDQIYTAAGASGLNAGTSEDWTLYFITVPANKVELWFWMESDRLLNPVFREFYSERDVVREERRMAIESTPTGKFEETFEAMFWQASPYSHPVVGWPSDIESITRAQAQDYFGMFYAPNNLTAVVVGDFDPARILALAQRYFGRIPRGAKEPPAMISEEVPQVAEKRFLAEADTNPEVQIRFHAVPWGHKDSYAMQLIGDLLSRRTGRLYTALVEGAEVAVGEPDAYLRPMKYEGFFEVGAEVKEGRSPGDVEAALLAELERLGKEPVSERELQKVKNQELANSYRRLQSNFYLLLQLLIYDANGDWKYINEAPARLQAVTAADIQRVAAKMFVKENRNVAIYTRKASGGAEDPEVAALPERLRGMVRQQLSEFEKEGDPAKLQETLVQLEQTAGQAPPQFKPALDLLKKRLQERIDELSAPEGGE
ncbi:MAG: M16 family metallopeptidase [Acidobacteriota bacterium]